MNGFLFALPVCCTLLLSTLCAGQSETVLHSFGATGDGYEPMAGPTIAPDGYLYGTAFYGGQGGGADNCTVLGCGIVYRVQLATAVESTFYEFSGTSDGGNPNAQLALDTRGVLYGITELGGPNGYGAVFRIANGALSDIYQFMDQSDGARGYSVSLDQRNVLYGTVGQGDDDTPHVFQLSHPNPASWVYMSLYSFCPYGACGLPETPIVFSSGGDGAAYGTALPSGGSSYGLVYQLLPTSVTGWTYSVIYAFYGQSDGGYPWAGLAIDANGNLYGAAEFNGRYGYGTIYELSPNADGTWSFTVLYAFGSGSDGQYPYSGALTFDSAGNLYGTTRRGGTYGYGTVYQLHPNGDGTWTESVVYSFQGAPGDGSYPQGNVAVDSAGNLYGITLCGGAYDPSSNCSNYVGGTVWEISP